MSNRSEVKSCKKGSRSIFGDFNCADVSLTRSNLQIGNRAAVWPIVNPKSHCKRIWDYGDLIESNMVSMLFYDVAGRRSSQEDRISGTLEVLTYFQRHRANFDFWAATSKQFDKLRFNDLYHSPPCGFL